MRLVIGPELPLDLVYRRKGMTIRKTKVQTTVLAVAAVVLAAGFAMGNADAAVALGSGSEDSNRSWRPQEAGDGLAGGEGRLWWTPSGAAWELGIDGRWTRIPLKDLPVGIADVQFITDSVLVTTAGAVWHMVEEGWIQAEPFPG